MVQQNTNSANLNICVEDYNAERLSGANSNHIRLLSLFFACHKVLDSCFLDTCPPRRVADLVHPDSSLGKQKYHLNPEKTNRRQQNKTHCLMQHILHADTNMREYSFLFFFFAFSLS